jgi:hypothetical protein
VAVNLHLRLSLIRAATSKKSELGDSVTKLYDTLESGGSITLRDYLDAFSNSLGPETWVCAYLLRIATTGRAIQFSAPRNLSTAFASLDFCVGRVYWVVKMMWRAIRSARVFDAPLKLPEKKELIAEEVEVGTKARLREKRPRVDTLFTMDD